MGKRSSKKKGRFSECGPSTQRIVTTSLIVRLSTFTTPQRQKKKLYYLYCSFKIDCWEIYHPLFILTYAYIISHYNSSVWIGNLPFTLPILCFTASGSLKRMLNGIFFKNVSWQYFIYLSRFC